MDAGIRHDFKALLVAQPFWDDTRDRRAFLRDLFASHPLYEILIVEGKSATVASDWKRSAMPRCGCTLRCPTSSSPTPRREACHRSSTIRRTASGSTSNGRSTRRRMTSSHE
jgi:hypothetical protein